MSRATATAEPPEEPPATRVSSIAFLVGPKYEFSVDEPCANESRLVRPIIIAPSASSFFTVVESIGDLKGANISELAVVSPFLDKKLSFRA